MGSVAEWKTTERGQLAGGSEVGEELGAVCGSLKEGEEPGERESDPKKETN